VNFTNQTNRSGSISTNGIRQRIEARLVSNMSKMISPYYPPRERWYGGIFYLGNALRRTMALDRIYLPHNVTFAGIIGGFLVPGLAIYLREPRLWGKLAMLGSGLLFCIFMMFLGYPLGNYAFGMMLSLHVTGFIHYCNPALVDKSFRFRIFFTVLVLMGMGFLLYEPLRDTIQNYWLMPLRINGQVIVAQRLPPLTPVARGEWIVYRLNRSSETDTTYDLRLYVRSGFGLAPVLAVAGDRIDFSTNAFYVNGTAQPLLPSMPTYGTRTVPENHWFIWPSYSISGEGNPVRIASMMSSMSDVSDSQFVGKPLKRWFWRKQTLR
jgi:hypothetical protein